jgi:hypothetical protein
MKSLSEVDWKQFVGRRVDFIDPLDAQARRQYDGILDDIVSDELGHPVLVIISKQSEIVLIPVSAAALLWIIGDGTQKVQSLSTSQPVLTV